jgi:hypothetical protein
VLPGPIALAAVGGLAGVAALEYMGAKRGEGAAPVDLESVGRPSEIAREVAEQLDRAAKPISGLSGSAATNAANAGGNGDSAERG